MFYFIVQQVERTQYTADATPTLLAQLTKFAVGENRTQE